MLTSYLTFSQGVTDSLIREMYQMWSDVYASYEVDHMTGDVQNSYAYYELQDSAATYSDLRSQILAAESDLVKKDWGLDWSAGYIYNTSPGMDVADNILYKSRVQTQVSWNILNNGFLENKTRSEVLQNKSSLAQLEQKQFENHDILDNWHMVIYRFNLDKVAILDKRLQLAEKRVAISYQLQSLGKITHEELLNNLESYAEISSLYKIYDEYNEKVANEIKLPNEDPLPLIDIDYSYGLNEMDVEVSDTAKQLMIENLKLENKFINQVNLSIYSRYNYYDLINSPINYRAFLTLGVGLGIPITFQKKEKEKLFELEKQQILMGQQEEDANQVRLKNDMLSYMYEFRYKLKQFNGFYYKKLKLEEILRKEQARFDVNKLDFNPLKALRWMDESMSIDIELIDLKQQLYLYVLRMMSVAPQLDVTKLVKSMELEELEIVKVQKQPKEVYVWSKTLEKHDLNTLVNYCAINEVTKVIVSASTEKGKFNEFAQKCQKLGISVEAMIGDNQMITDYTENKITEKVTGIDLSNIDAIHLDVEPQTFDDWSDRKSYYTEEYLKMYDLFHNWSASKGLAMSVSLPTYFDESATRKIMEKGGLVYFMCYENVSNSHLEKKLGTYKGTDFVIALRPEDFDNMVQLESKIDELNILLAPKRFIIHDLERLLKFDP